ncbi:MAG: YHS domain-containing protein [Actinomycetota bacterium]
MAQVKDPVCGMTIEESDAVATVEHDGTRCHFCSQECADEFRDNPSDYT